MKRLSLLLALIMMISLAGCCYEPGTEGMYGMDSWYQQVPTFPADEFGYDTPDVTQPNGEVITEEISNVIPDPEIDLDAMPQRKEDDFVKVTDYIPDIVVELRYASMNNFTGKRVYNFSDLFLAFWRVSCFSSPLYRIGCTIEFSGLSSIP